MSAANLEMQSLNNPQSPEEPASSNILRDSRSKKLLVVLTILSVLISCVGIFLFFQNQSLKSQLGLPTFKFPWMRATCSYEGQEYQAGESVPSIDGCNSCSCDESGQVACTDMACESSKTFQKMIDKIVWQEYLGEKFKYAYPSNLIRVHNPREFETTRDVQYFLLNQQTATEYRDCLQTAKDQHESYKLNAVEPDWVDWEGACDINRVILLISVGKKSWEDITDKSSQSNENSQPYSIKSNQGFLWIVSPSGGMGDTIVIEAHTQRNGYVYGIVISSHLRGMSKFIDPNDNYAESEYDLDNKYFEAFKSIAHQILSTFEFTNSQSSFSGTLESYEWPADDPLYHYLLALDQPYFDELNARGPRDVRELVVVPSDTAINETLKAHLNQKVTIEGEIEWGLGETRHLKASKIALMPDN